MSENVPSRRRGQCAVCHHSVLVRNGRVVPHSDPREPRTAMGRTCPGTGHEPERLG